MVWVVQHVQKPTLLYGGYNALEGNTPLLNELPVLLNAPVKDDLHTTIVALCVQFGNTCFIVFHLLLSPPTALTPLRQAQGEREDKARSW